MSLENTSIKWNTHTKFKDSHDWPGQILSPGKQKEEKQYLNLLRMFHLTDSGRLINNRAKCDFTAAEIQSPGKQISVPAPTTWTQCSTNQKTLQRGWRTLEPTSWLQGIGFLSYSLPLRTTWGKISSSTWQIHTLNMMAKRNWLLTVPLRVSKLWGAAPGAKPYPDPPFSGNKPWSSCTSTALAEVTQTGFN